MIDDLLFIYKPFLNPKEGGVFLAVWGRVETALKTLSAHAATFLGQINQKRSRMTADIIFDQQSTWKMPNIPQFFSEAAQTYPSLSAKFSQLDTPILEISQFFA